MNGMQEMYNRILRPFYKYINKEELSSEEKNELGPRLTQSSRVLWEEMNETLPHEGIKQCIEHDEDTMLTKFAQKRAARHRGAKLISLTGSRWWRYGAAAILLILFSAGAYFIFFNHKVKRDMATAGPVEKKFANDVEPGTEKAILTLSDGTKITLDNTTNGTIAQQGNTVVLKEDGLLAYNADKRKPEAAILYNSLTTERGEEFRSLVLSDGTKVWLNSVSSIHFPTAFTSKERMVEITGEVYFEVAKNLSRPFRVKANGMEVEVLGTHFNINAYTDENSMTTSLLEGAVSVKKGAGQVVIKPGQQAQVTGNAVRVINDADVNAAVAWKNGLQVFNKTDIKTILRQISRWYDVDIEYKGDIKVPKFYGEIPRTVTLSEVLKIIEINSKLQFTIEGKKVMVKQP